MSDLVIEGFRLSPQQKRLWLLQRDAPVYLSQCAAKLDGIVVDVGTLRRVLDSLVSRHEILRTTFRCLPGMDVPVQVIGEAAPVPLDVVRLDRELTPEDLEGAVHAQARHPFDFERGPLLRVSLLEPAEGAKTLVVTLPAICADSASLKNLLAEIHEGHEAVVEGREPDGEAVQYADFSEWQNDLLQDEGGGEARTFWGRERSARRDTPVLPFEMDSVLATFQPRPHRVWLKEDLAAAVEALAAARGTTPAVVLLGCWEVLLLRVSGERSFSLGVLEDGRSFEQLQGALGLFARYLPIECKVAEDFLFPEVLELAGHAVRQAADHQDYFVWEDEAAHLAFGFDYSDWRDLSLVRHHSQIERFKLRLSCVRQRDGLAAEIFYDAGTLEPAAVERLGAQLEQLVRSVVENPESAVSELEILGETERRQVLFDWNETAREYPRGAGLVELFEAAVARTPKAPAVLWGKEALSFAELDRKANRLAHRLLELGVGRESRVGLCLGRGTEAIVGLWGILKAGAAYVPLDPAQPRPRLEGMMRDAGISVAVTDAQIEGLTCVLVDGCAAPETSPGVAVDEESLAYVLYTSGSTGRPKGVMVRQGSVVNLARSLRERVYDGSGEGLRMSVNAPLTFDASVKQVIQLLWGHALVIVPEEVRADGESLLAALIAREVQVLDCTPSQLHLLLAAGLESAGTRLERVLVGGEAINPQLWSRLGGIDKIRFFNVYGPTECTVDATAWEVTGERPVLGRAIPNARVYVLDRALRPVPVSLAGELCIGGEGVGRGYVGRPELTAERFVPDPFGGEPGARLYRTGDLARWSEDGLLEYLGRVDHQVKVRGVRIELGEIEEVLRSQSGVEEAVVALREDEPGDARLVAYVVPRRSHRAVLDGRVRRELPNGLAVVEQNRNETEYLYEEIFAKRCYVQHGVGLPEGACVFDVGANIGMFTLFVRQQCPTARIYAFEPIAPIYETLRLNAELYAPGAKLFAFGLSDTERTEAFTYYPRYSMMSSQRDYSRPSEEVEVVKRFLSNERSAALLEEADELLAGRFEGESHPGRLRRLSQVLREEGVERIDLLKVDVQRAEMDVLRGIDEADWSRIDQVVMEVHDARGEESEGRSREIVAFLESHGFQAVAEQDELLVGTDRYNLYAVRESRRPAAEAAPAQPEAVLSPGAVRDLLKHRLPEIMVPSVVVLLEELPLTRNGKVDRSALPAPEQERDETSGVQEARTPFEEVLTGIWSEVLKAPRVGIEESFFDLGGHSLLATQLISRVREVFRVDLPLRMLFEFPTVAQLALRVEESMRSGRGAELPPIGKAPRDIELPLSFSQQRLWFLDQLTPGSTAYNSPRAVRLEGELDVAALEAVLGELVRRHESLRTSFPVVGGESVQRIAPAGPYALAMVDLSGLDGAAREEEAARLAVGEAARPFDLARGPLLRTALLRLEEREHLVLFSLHHIVSDAWSLAVLVREMVVLYEACRERRPSPLPELPIQYADYAWWQRQWLQGETLATQVEYWRAQLGGSPEALELPADRPRRALRSVRGAHQRLSLGRALSAALRDLSRREGATPFMTLLAGYQALLYRSTGQSSINVGSPVAGRRRLETEGLIGFFVNTLVLHGEIAGERSFRDLMAGAREAALGAYTHQDLPFEKLVEELAPERDTAHSPLFQVMLTFQNTPVESLEARGLRFSPVDVEIGTVKFDLTLMLADDPEVIAGELQYSADLFDPSRILRLGRHLQTLLAAAVAEPGRPIAELPLWSEAERHQLLVEWNDSAAPGFDRPCLHEIFEAQAARTPEAPAVVFRGEVLSYAELDRRAAALAGRLRAFGVRPETRVALLLERSHHVVVSLLGVLKAGGAYLPLDEKAPAARVAALLADAGARVAITSGALREALPHGSVRVLSLDAEAVGRSEGPALSAARPTGGNLAYVLYTSGSTGAPKGVAVEHDQAVSYLRGIVERLDLPQGSSYATVSTFAADLGNTVHFAALGTGGCLHVVPEEDLADPERFADYISGHAIDCLKIVPSHLAALLTAARPERVLPRRRLVMGGEAASEALVERLRALAPQCVLLNHYGPTETTVGVLSGPIEGPLPPSGTAPLGRPIPGARVYILDRNGSPVPAGVSGELCVGGRSVSRGYPGAPEATAAKLVPDPFGGIPGGRLYRTGDLARHLPDGRIEFLGRIDRQVKVRGFRIEPGEIEAALRLCPGVRDAVVDVRAEGGDRRLVAWVVPGMAEAFSAGELRELLRARLPEPMIPSILVPLPALPLTPNGKVDRRALPVPEEGRERPESAVPRTAVEQVVASIWSELLGREVGLGDDFFDLGGHSLLATRAISRVRQAFQQEIPLRALFESPTLAGFSAVVEKGMRRDHGLEAPPIVRVPRDGALPLSFAQQRLWFLDQLDSERPDYNIPMAVRLRGPLSPSALERTLSEIVRRHEVLRTTFDAPGGEPVQVIHPPAPVEMAVTDLRLLDGAGREEAARRMAAEEALRPFSLAHGPLLRASLLRLADEEHVLLLTLHHIVSDEWSRGVLVREVADLYDASAAGRPAGLPELPVQYADYSAWQRRWLQGEALDAQVAYWRERLAGSESLLALPTDRPRPAVPSSRGRLLSRVLGRDLTDRLASLGRTAGTTSFMTLLAAFQALLAAHAGQESVSVGTPVSGRNRLEIEGLIGFFVNTLVLRLDLGGDPSFRQLLDRVRETALGAYMHQDLPFEKLVDELQPERDLSHSPLFQVMFALQSLLAEERTVPGLELSPLEMPVQTVKFDLMLSVTETPSGLRAALGYRTDLFDGTTAARLLERFAALLERIAVRPDLPLSELLLPSEVERHLVLAEWSAGPAPAGREPLLDLFAAQVERSPGAVAVSSGGVELSYRELDLRSNRLARRLRREGVGPEVLVGVFVERSVEMVVGLLGILKAGGAYLPMDPAYPRERLAWMLEDGRPLRLLTQQSLLPVLPEGAPPALCLDSDWEKVATESGALISGRRRPEGLAYVIFTSGSTGRPKGVQVHDGGLDNFLGYFRERLELTGDDTFLAVTTLSFDIAALELFLPLCVGARVVIASREEVFDGYGLAQRLRDSGATAVQATPSTWRMLLTVGWEGLPGMKLLCGAEALTQELADLLLARSAALWNVYGPTETTIWSTLSRVERGEAVSIGRPIADTQLHLLDRNLRPVPVGIVGDLYLGGAGVTRGYLGAPHLTAEKFIPHPFAFHPGDRLYRTGDLARFNADGTVQFLGRVDAQVKVRGFRIELGEIEAALGRHPVVRQAVALVRNGGSGPRVIAYVVPEPSAEGLEPSPDELRSFLQRTLPDYMIPSLFVALEELPLTPSGKIDRRALPASDLEAPAGYAAPRTPVEELLASVWADVLRLDQVGIHDNFFGLGGDSILSIQIVSRARQAGVHLTPKEIFQHQTIADLARQARYTPEEIASRPGAGRLDEDPYPLSPLQRGLLFHALYDPASEAYFEQLSLRLEGDLEPGRFRRAWEQVVERHPILRTAFLWEALDEPLQAVRRQVELPWEEQDWRGAPEDEQARRLEAFLAEDRRRGFDPGQAPLMRLTLVRLREDAWRLTWSHHHLLLDGWCLPIVFREVTEIYEALASGRPPRLEPVRPYRAFIEWLESQESAELERFWRSELAGFSAPTDLGLTPASGAGEQGSGGVLPARLSAPVTARLTELARRQRLTLNTFVQGAWAFLLARYSGETDVVFGAVVAGRPPELEGVESMLGLFANTLPVRARLAPGQPLLGFLAELQARQVELRRYAHSSLAEVQRWSEVPPGAPLFETLLAFENYPVDEAVGEQSSSLRITDARFQERPHYAVTLVVAPGPELRIKLRYDRRRLGDAAASRLLGHLGILLEGLAVAPERSPAALPLLSPAEQHQLVGEWNDTMRDFGPEVWIHELFAARAAADPQAVALVFEGEPMSYGELDRRTGRLADHLISLGVGPDVPVGVHAERSPELVIALLAILRAGGAYLPLDPEYPRERLAFMIDNARIPVLLAQERIAGDLPDHRAQVVLLDGEEPYGAGEVGGPPHLDGSHLAYVLYTSGSTGRPKGVAVTHRGIRNRLLWMQELCRLTPEDRVLQKTPFSFDVSVWELFLPFLAGSRLVVALPGGHRDSAYLADLISEQEITVVHFVPSMLRAFVEEPRAARCSSLRLVVCSGEALAPDLRDRLLALLPQVELHNLYGPTEASVDVTAWICRHGDTSPVLPIGRPIANTTAHVVDRHLSTLPLGVPGELCLGGVQLARNYLTRPDLTAERFVPDPFGGGQGPGARLYRTGDLARWLPDGAIEFLGRLDHQVKIRGFRIELGEIEAALREHPAVRQAVVAARGEHDGSLVAYLVPEAGADPSSTDLRERLEARLPAYMVPSSFVVLEELPLLPNGKVDRRALPEPGRGGERPFVAPRSPVEELLAGLWSEVLGTGPVGAHASFFELGGHSLLATRLASRVRAAFNVELPLREIFEQPTLAALARRLEALLAAGGGVGLPAIGCVPRGGPLPLSFAQQRLWFLDQMEPGSAFYNIASALRVTGLLDVALLERTLSEIARRHESLRTTFPAEGGRPWQRIAPAEPVPVPMIDLAYLPAEGREREARRLAAGEAARPFDLAGGPLLRVSLLRLAADEHLALLTLHHIVGDGWSMGVLTREIATHYRAFRDGRPSPLPELPVQYADFAVWQRDWMAGELLEAQVAYWRERLGSEPPVLELPLDRPRPAVQTFRGDRQRLALSPSLTASLRELGRAEGGTLFMTLLAAFQALLFRYAGQSEVSVGTPIAGRRAAETEGLIGFFVNMLVLRADLSGEPGFRELLARVRRAALEAYSHQDVPFEKLVEELQPQRDLSHSPLFQVMLAFEEAPAGPSEVPRLTFTPLEKARDTAKLDLTLTLGTAGDELRGELEYNADLFEAATARRLCRHFETLLASAAAHPRREISALALWTEAERHQVLAEWNDTGIAPVQGLSLADLFAAQAARTPEAIALSFQGLPLTYRELDRRANRLSHHLRELGVGPESRVGVCLRRSPDMVVALLGTLKAGGAYVPLDPTYPRERLAAIVAEAAPAVLLTEEPLAPLAEEVAGAAPAVVALDRDRPAVDSRPDGMPAGRSVPGSLAYVIYTSGSTGRPKGVAIEQESAAALMGWARRMFSPEELAGVLASTSINFDLAVFELFAPLCWGGRVILAEDALRLPEIAEAAEVTLINTVPSAMAELVRAQAVPAAVRTVSLAGEALDGGLVDRIYALGTVTRVLNLYGPSEDTTYSTGGRMEAGDRRAPSIGRPVDGTSAFLLDAGLRPVPVGAPGELCLGGNGLARGYLARPGETAERFVPDPCSGRRGARLYRTGDLARFRPDGRLDFLGRMDHQVKVRGFRIELGEIEAALLRHPAVRQAAVLAREDRPGGKRLTAYLVARMDSSEPGELRAFLRETLPEYMVPSTLVWLDSMPLTPNGKIDRRALPALERNEAGTLEEGAGPRTATEELLAGVWTEILGVPSVSRTDDFFALGGHSLLATQVVSRLRESLGVELSLRALFEHPVLSDLADRVDRGLAQREGVHLPIARSPRDLALPLSSAQRRLWLADQLASGEAAYNIHRAVRLEGELSPGVLQWSLDEIVRRHEVLRTTFRTLDDLPVQEIAPPAPAPLPWVDLSALPPVERGDEARRLMREAAARPFDLSRNRLLRVLLLRLSPGEHALFVTLHHIVADGWSLGVLVRELRALYAAFRRGLPSPLAELPVQYADYAAWQQRSLDDEALAGSLEHWKRHLGGAPLLKLPTDRPREARRTHRGALESLSLGPQLSAAVLRLSREAGATPFMTFLAVFNVLLHHVSRQEDIVVGTNTAGRTRRETEGLIGCFLNLLVLRSDLSGNPEFRQLLERVKRLTLNAYTHQEVPFDRVVEALRPQRETADGQPLFQVKIDYQSASSRPALELPGLELTGLDVDPGVTHSDLTLYLLETGDGIEMSLQYSTELFDRPRILSLLAGLRTLLERIVERPGIALSELDAALTEEEKRQFSARKSQSIRETLQRKRGSSR